MELSTNESLSFSLQVESKEEEEDEGSERD
jgi:hypothetical protein